MTKEYMSPTATSAVGVSYKEDGMPIIGIIVLFAGFGAFFAVEENEYGFIPLGVGMIILGIGLMLSSSPTI